MKKPLIITIIAVIILALSGGAFWYFKAQEQEIINENELVVENGEESEEVKGKEKEQIKEEDKIDTSDWQTYKNEEYGFELEYPKELSVLLLPDRAEIVKIQSGILKEIKLISKNNNEDYYLNLGIQKNINNYKSISEYIDKELTNSMSEMSFISKTDFIKNSIKGQEVVMSNLQGEYKLIIFLENNLLYIFSPDIKIYTEEKYNNRLDIINKILTSFKIY